MCASKEIRLSLLLPLLIVAIFVAMNFPELRRYLRIESM